MSNLSDFLGSGISTISDLSNVTVSASDPAVDTNPTAVGGLWLNKTSGEMFTCTDATAGENVWTNAGDGTGAVTPPAMSSPTLSSPADEGPNINVTYVITSVDANDDKIVFDAQASTFTVQSVSVGSATKVGTTVEITGFSASSYITLTLQYTAETTYNNRAKSIDTSGVYPDSAWSSTDTIVIVVQPFWYGGRGLFAGGYSSGDRIGYITMASTGNATSFGDLTNSRGGVGGASNGSRGVFGGGGYSTSSAALNTIDYVTISTTSVATDFGDLTVARRGIAGCANGTKGLFAGGASDASNIVGKNVIDYITIATTGNATDFGNLTVARVQISGCASTTRGVFGGGYDQLNVMDYITIASTGNATDFGDLSVARKGTGALSSTTRGVFAGGVDGGYPTVIDYITMATTGNAVDFGDLTTGRQGIAGCSSPDRGVFASSNTIDYITVASTGNATDFGDMVASRSHLAAVSGD